MKLRKFDCVLLGLRVHSQQRRSAHKSLNLSSSPPDPHFFRPPSQSQNWILRKTKTLVFGREMGKEACGEANTYSQSPMKSCRCAREYRG